MHRIDIFIFIHESGSNINNNNNNRPNRKLNYKHLIKYYNVVAKLAETFTVEVYRNTNLSCLLLRTHLDRLRSIATRVASSMVRVQSACLLCTPVALQKRLNRLSCRLGADLRGRKEPCVRWGSAHWRHLRIRSISGAAMLSHAKLLWPFAIILLSIDVVCI